MYGTVGTLVLDHPEKRNALSRQLIDEVVESLSRFASEYLRVVVLRAQPGTKFGLWVTMSRSSPKVAAIRWVGMILYAIWCGLLKTIPRPLLPCEVAFACDLIIAAPSATFAVTPARFGVPYNVSGMLTFLNACSLRVAKEMGFTAKPISAERAAMLGIINHMVSMEQP